MTRPTDPLTEIINEAVKAAVADQIAPLLEALKQPIAAPEPIKPVAHKGERFVSMSELCERLGVNRTTLHRREKAGKLPQRKTFPDGRVGWTASQIDDWFAAATDGTDPQRNADLAARITH